MKNLFLILLVIIMAVGGVLSGCAEPTPAQPTEPTPAQPTEPTPAPPAEPTPAPPAEPTPAPPTEPTPKYGGTLRALFTPIPPAIGWPPAMIANPIGHVVQTCLETLLRADKNGDVYPWLAESYQIADDRMFITFTLRKGVKFHDGSDFNAEVVKWNLDNWIDAKAQPFWKSVDIIDEYTLRVNLTEWRNTLPLSFCEGIAPVFMISKEAFDKNGIDWVKGNPVGTGPFIFDSFIPDVSFKAVKNPDYWVEGKPYLDAIEFTFIADATTSVMTMQTGEADMGGAPDAKTADEYKALGFIVEYAKESTWVLVPDTANPDSPWANKKVREAVEHAIDRGAIAKSLGFGYMGIPYQIPPQDSLPYDPNFSLGRDYDLEKAKQLLAEAGYPDGFETTIILFPQADRDIMLVVQSNLAQVGIDAELEITDFGKWVTYMGPGRWPENSALFTPIPRFDKAFLGGTQFTVSNFGQSWLRTPELMAALKAALTPVTPDIELIRAFNDIITKDALLIPVHEGLWFRTTAPYVVHEFDERGYILFWDVEDTWLDK